MNTFDKRSEKSQIEILFPLESTQGELRQITHAADEGNRISHSIDLTNSNVVHFAGALDEHLLISVFDLNGNVIYVNWKFCEGFMTSSNEILGKKYQDVMFHSNSNDYFEEILGRIKKGEIWKGDIQCTDTSGKTRWNDTTIIPCFDQYENIYQFISICSDITARKNSEAELYASRNELRALANHLEQVREDERKRIAREIHDELGQHLLALKMDVSQLYVSSVGVHPDLARTGLLIMQGIDETMRHVKLIINDLRPVALDLGLSDAMRSHVRSFSKRTGIACEINISENKQELPDDIVITFFRVLQESLVNVSRHAHASKVNVIFNCDVNGISLEITDNGKGFVLDGKSRRKSFGLLGMRERIEAFGGKFSIETQLQGGTKVIAVVPIDFRTRK
jgi:PAS domain S-box-containing protein